MTNETQMEQGNIKALFPNLNIRVWKDGQECEIIGCNNNEVQLRTLTEGGYKKVGVVFWTDCFLLPNEKRLNLIKYIGTYTTDGAREVARKIEAAIKETFRDDFNTQAQNEMDRMWEESKL